MKFMKIAIIVLFFISLIPQISSAEGARKIAYMSALKIIDSYYKTKEADEKLEKEGKEKQKEREKMVEKINKLRDEAELLSREKREAKQKELNEMMRTLQDFDREARLTLKRESDDARREILKEVDDVIQEYGEKNGYDLILDDRTLLYANEAIDISDEIIKILNKGKR